MDNIAETAILLHTWSLSVEEQFYLFLPVFLLFIQRLRLNTTLSLIAVFLITLIASEVLKYSDQSFSFYASITRFWQFLAGGLLVIHQQKLSDFFKHRLLRELIIVTSVLYLTFAVFMTDHTSFPGLDALPVTIATVALIMANGQSKDWSYRLLFNKASVYIGDISYSLYLWHWPVIVIFNYKLGHDFYGLAKIQALVLCLAFSIVSYYLVENKFRNLNFNYKTIKLYFLFLLAFLLLLFIGNKTIYWQYSEESLRYQSYLNYHKPLKRDAKCFLLPENKSLADFDKENCTNIADEKLNILLLGDSHADHWYSGLSSNVPDTVNIAQITSFNCPPLLNSDYSDICRDLMSWAFESNIPKSHYDMIILSARWHQSMLKDLQNTVDYLADKTQKIVIFGPMIEYDAALPRLLAKSEFKENLVARSNYPGARILDNKLSEFAVQNNIKYYSVASALCKEGAGCLTTVNGVPIVYDYGHLTHEGAVHILSEFQIWTSIITD